MRNLPHVPANVPWNPRWDLPHSHQKIPANPGKSRPNPGGKKCSKRWDLSPPSDHQDRMETRMTAASMPQKRFLLVFFKAPLILRPSLPRLPGRPRMTNRAAGGPPSFSQ